jgi:hypothetical protein
MQHALASSRPAACGGVLVNVSFCGAAVSDDALSVPAGVLTEFRDRLCDAVLAQRVALSRPVERGQAAGRPALCAIGLAVLSACPWRRTVLRFAGGVSVPRTTAALAGPWAHSIPPGAGAPRSQPLRWLLAQERSRDDSHAVRAQASLILVAVTRPWRFPPSGVAASMAAVLAAYFTITGLRRVCQEDDCLRCRGPTRRS